MANEPLVRAIKDIIKRAKSGDTDGAYHGYRDLFASPEFSEHRIEDQRQALELMVLMKGAPKPASVAMIDAHCTARERLTSLVAMHGAPSDHELLGICHGVLGDDASASTAFKAGLALERERDPQSKLCGTLMWRVSTV